MMKITLKATLVLLALTVSAHAGNEINLSCSGTAKLFIGPPRLAGAKPVTTSLIVDLDRRSVLFYGARAEFSAGVSAQDSVLHFDWKLVVDKKSGHPVVQDSDATGPVRGYAFEGSIDRVSGIANILYTTVTSEDDPNFRETAGTEYELLCKPVKPLF